MNDSSSISRRLLKFIQDTNQVTRLELFRDFDYRYVEELEKLAPLNIFYREIIKRIESQLDHLSIENIQAQRQIHNAYCEARIYMELRPLVFIERNPESELKEPDFRWQHNGETVYAEIKAVSMAGSDRKYTDLVESGLETSIELEQQLNSGKTTAIAEIEIDPLSEPGKPYDPRDLRALIHKLIRKNTSLYKADQFGRGPTLLIADITQWALGQRVKESLVPYFSDGIHPTHSGVLWNVAFGKIGHMILVEPEFAGLTSLKGELELEGVMHMCKNIDGIVFRYGLNKPKYFGLIREDSPDSIKASVHRTCELYNDESNTEEWHILEHLRVTDFRND